MVRDVRQAETAIGRVRYGCTRQEEANMRFRRSIFCVRDIRKGAELTRENIRVIRPGYGLEPKYFPEILGQCALQDIKRGMPLRMDLIGSGCGQALEVEGLWSLSLQGQPEVLGAALQSAR